MCISTSFWVLAAPKSWSKYTTHMSLLEFETWQFRPLGHPAPPFKVDKKNEKFFKKYRKIMSFILSSHGLGCGFKSEHQILSIKIVKKLWPQLMYITSLILLWGTSILHYTYFGFILCPFCTVEYFSTYLLR